MHHSWRNRYEDGVIYADAQHLISWRLTGAILPEMKLVRPVEKQKAIRLFPMLVRTSGNSRMGDREITHGRVEPVRKGVRPEELDQPPARVGMLFKGPYLDAADHALSLLIDSARCT